MLDSNNESPGVTEVSRSIENWNKKGIVISPDLDGILSGVVLASKYNSEIIGIYHTNIGAESRLLRLGNTSNDELKTALWVDVDICSNEVQSIGQHIIHRELSDVLSLRHPHSYNPHDTLPRSWSSRFQDKFPYSTSDIIIEGLRIETTHLSGLSTLRCLADSMYEYGSLLNPYSTSNPIEWNREFFGDSEYLTWINSEDFLISIENLQQLTKIQSTLIANGILETEPEYRLGFIKRITGQAIDSSIISSGDGLQKLISSVSEIAGFHGVRIRGEVSGIAGRGEIYSHPRKRSGGQHYHELTADFDEFLRGINAFSYSFSAGQNKSANSHLRITTNFNWNE